MSLKMCPLFYLIGTLLSHVILKQTHDILEKDIWFVPIIFQVSEVCEHSPLILKVVVALLCLPDSSD